MNTQQIGNVTWHIGTKAECKEKAAALGFTISIYQFLHLPGRTGTPLIYNGPIGQGGLLIKYDVSGLWCFQVTQHQPQLQVTP